MSTSYHFPKDFVWGAATAAYQSEGAWTFLKTNLWMPIIQFLIVKMQF